MDSGLAVPVFNQGDDPIAYLNKAMAFLTVVASLRFHSTNNQLITSSNMRNHATIQDGKVIVQQVQGRQGQSYVGTNYKGNATSFRGNNAGGQTRVVKCYNCQGEGHMARQCTQAKRPMNAAWFKEKAMLAETEDLDAYDFDCDDVPNAKVVLMANLSNYEKESKYMDKEIDLEKKIEELDSIVYKVGQSTQTVHMFRKPQVFYDDNHKQALGYQNPFYLKKDQRIKPTLYDGSVISSQHAASLVINDEETLILEEVIRSKMLAKQNDPMSKEKKLNTTSINYVELNQLSEYFGKRFVPQQELSDEQTFWLQTSHPNTDQSALPPVKIKAPKELPKQTTPDAIIEGEWGFKHTKAVFLKEIIPFLKTLTDIFNVFDKDILNECFEIHKKELFLENDRILHQIMSQDVMIFVMNSTAVFNDVNLEMQSSEFCVKCLDLDVELLNKKNVYNDLSKKYFENKDLKAQLQAKDTTICMLKEHIKSIRENDKEEKFKHDMDEIKTINIELEHNLKGQIQENVFVTTTLQNELRRLKGKLVLDNANTITNATTIALGMFKLDIEPLSQRLKNNRDAHEDYLKKTIENTDTICGLVQHARKQNPSEPLLDSACKFTKHLQEFTQMAINFAAGERLRKLRPEEAWKTIENLTQYEEEEWNERESLDYIDANLEQELESMECRVESLTRNEVLLEYEVGFTFPKRPYHEALKGRILSLIDQQEDQVRQLEEDMRKTKDTFMCFPDSLIATMKVKIEAQRAHSIKIEKITRFPTHTPTVTPETLKPTMVHRVSLISNIEPTNYRTPYQYLNSNLKMPLLHSFEENKLEYEDEDAVEIKMMGIRKDKESLEHNLYENDITPIICHNFSLTLNLPIKPKDPGSFWMKVIFDKKKLGSS
ncbi:integrase, catalytic region, zinc finger, CCHC-type containing protein [Tanacetum coccineum]|uniref:Integrase, catalytic region, zinc finger, CCHC-type containing protein n=1 Tax=Tanacetum coccineum TaxID=301880 RepID=A0ABQ5CAU6_9ASTR